jgi:hypothetical protein
MFVVALVCAARLLAQTEASQAAANLWDFNASISGYLVPQG